mmetsp:Transcript_24598/g.70903  ORF Transcript_24598/g.70903 Transcript_24598/m.70903 type:complete len:304 (-) Transcript_24598:2960-3871(-)
MSDGGTLPWKVQRVDESRGPACDYSAVHKPLPAPPKNTRWYKDNDGHWSLIRDDSSDKSKIKYKLAVGEAWHLRGNRPVPTLIPIPLERNENKAVGSESLDGDTTDQIAEKDGEEEHPTAVEGVHYLIHTIVPSDTFAGLCLRYRIKPHDLRRVNRFSGNNLRLAPHNLIIPLGPDGQGLNGGQVREQNRNCPEFKLHALQGEFPALRQAECKAYLELADWHLGEAIKAARDDEKWEKREEQKAEAAQSDRNVRKVEKKAEEQKVVAVHVGVPVDFPTENTDEDGGLKEPLLRNIELPFRHER